MRGLPHLLAFLCGAITVAQAHAALGPESLANGVVLITLGVLAIGCLSSYFLWGRMAHWTSQHGRELVGTGFVIIGLFLVLAFWDAAAESPMLEGWLWVVIVLSFFSFFLHSQQSFMMFLVIFVSLLLRGLSFEPSVPAALLFGVFAMFLLASLCHGERITRFPMGARRFEASVPLKAALRMAAVLMVLFGVFYGLKPPAEAITAEDWVRWFQEGGADARGGGEGTEPTPLHWMRPSPAVPRDGVASGPVSISFNADLKFGDGNVVPSDSIAFYVDVRDADGAAFDPDQLEAYWKAGAVSDYDGRRWTGDDGGRERLEGDGVRVVLGAAGTGPRIEQRYVVSPLSDRTLLALYPVEEVWLDAVEIDREGILHRARRQNGWFKYSVVSRSNTTDRDIFLFGGDEISVPHERYLHVPQSVRNDPVFRRWLVEIGDSPSIPVTQAKLEELDYTTHPELPEGADPTLAFLEEGRGYCQHFASAMTLLLRAQGIPARVGLGFAGGEWAHDGDYFIVRRRHAHAWVEVHYRYAGWVIYDPAAGPADTFVRTGGATARPRPDRTKPPGVRPEDPARDPAKDRPEPIRPPRKNPDGRSDTPKPVPPKDDPRPTDPPKDPSRTRRPPIERREGRTPPPRSDSVSRFDSIWGSVDNRSARKRDPAAALENEAESEREDAAPGARGNLRNPLRAAAGYALSSVARDLGLVAALVAGVFLAVMVWRRRPQKEAPADPEGEPIPGAPAVRRSRARRRAEFEIVRIYLRMLRALARRGFKRGPAETADEFAGRRPGGVDAVGALTALFVRARYGPEPLDPTDHRMARRHLNAVLKALKH